LRFLKTRNYKLKTVSALPLFVPRVGADNPEPPAALHRSAVQAHFFDGCFDLHACSLNTFYMFCSFQSSFDHNVYNDYNVHR